MRGRRLVVPAKIVRRPDAARSVSALRALLDASVRKVGGWAPPAPPPIRLGFRAPDRVVALDPPLLAGLCGEFGRDATGRVAWLGWGGRLAPRPGD